MPSISTKRLCLFLLLSTLYLILSVAWFFLAIPQLIISSSDVDLFGAFAGTAVWVVTGASMIICVIRKA
ncbi:hypothetical protein BOH74_20685 [Pseudomonas versuta]|uniref:Uncharacterized protein n=1 Tax=Pseudomonas versuta TaxID=1788301 RepID=A0A853ZQ06_9PSED|nr:hypothetical protein BOH74_20685 [Pseudomonas versuta]